MVPVNADRNLLFGLLALQNGLIDEDQLVTAFAAWSSDKSRQIEDYLVDRGDMDADQCNAIQAIVALQEKKHGGSSDKSLAAIPARHRHSRARRALRQRNRGSSDPRRLRSSFDPVGYRGRQQRFRLRRIARQRSPALGRLLFHARSALDSLADNIAVVDGSGKIVAVNSAWREFAVANGAAGANIAEGADYFGVCARATGADTEAAFAFATGIRDVFAGHATSFELEYPCHSPNRFRWFIARVTPLQGTGHRMVVVAHINVTERRLAEDEARDSANRLSIVSRRWSRFKRRSDVTSHASCTTRSGRY